ncbi:hypothetical protein FA13DRAFT_644265 [Coprinellus micaceus]|uniref:Uncharacterized protein n=1 Tax=Coprinellus micaceus TaxID=71717 RepID=A0A4Y7T5L7_COPMI|nr:hypothetical protein FA13DRAFT_644265 [Coprinellus micaceus]
MDLVVAHPTLDLRSAMVPRQRLRQPTPSIVTSTVSPYGPYGPRPQTRPPLNLPFAINDKRAPTLNQTAPSLPSRRRPCSLPSTPPHPIPHRPPSTLSPPPLVTVQDPPTTLGPPRPRPRYPPRPPEPCSGFHRPIHSFILAAYTPRCSMADPSNASIDAIPTGQYALPHLSAHRTPPPAIPGLYPLHRPRLSYPLQPPI